MKGCRHAQSGERSEMTTVNDTIAGYLHAGYAKSLAEFGAPRPLPASGGWILERPIPGSNRRDAMGCYPLFSCQNWLRLTDDLEELHGRDVVLAVVTDPFGDYEPSYLERCFNHIVLPFKEHYCVNLNRPMESFVCPHHRRNARRALQQVEVQRCDHPWDGLDDWVGLYDTLVQKHEITGIAAFSRAAFEKQFGVPGLVVFRAVHRGRTVGMLLWYVQGAVAYYHLGAHSAVGYELKVSFALFFQAIEYFAGQGLDWLALGGGAGVRNASDGLARFKQGWATEVRTAYFCGHIFDAKAYAELAEARCPGDADYFPAYRQGEFG